MDLERIVNYFKGFADASRVRILNLLSATTELNVGQICDLLDLPQSTVSRHVSQLRLAGIVKDRRDGAWVYYRIVGPDEHLREKVIKDMVYLAELCPVLKDDLVRLNSILSNDFNQERF